MSSGAENREKAPVLPLVLSLIAAYLLMVRWGGFALATFNAVVILAALGLTVLVGDAMGKGGPALPASEPERASPERRPAEAAETPPSIVDAQAERAS